MSIYSELTHRHRALLSWMGNFSKKLSPDNARTELYFDGETVGFSNFARKETDLNELLALESMRWIKVRLVPDTDTAYVSISDRAYLAAMRNFDPKAGPQPSSDELNVLERAFAETGGKSGTLFSCQTIAEFSPYKPADVALALDRLVAKGYVNGTRMGIYSLTPEGAAVAEETEQQPDAQKQSHTVIVGGNVHGGLQVGTSHSTQNVTVVVNQQTSTAITQLFDVVQKSELDELDKEDLLHEIKRLEQLASKNDPKAKSKIVERLDVIEKSIGVSQKLAVVAIPLIAMIRSHFGL